MSPLTDDDRPLDWQDRIVVSAALVIGAMCLAMVLT